MNRMLLGVVFVLSIGACSGGNGISQGVADAWPAKWCQAEPGITKDQLVAIMGQPTSGSAEFMSWSAHQFQFNAFLEADGTVRQLDTNQHSLSDAEKSALACDTIRTRESEARKVADAKPQRAMPSACALVTEAQMSTILGTPMAAQANGDNKCIYKPTAAVSPYVEFSVDWGDGEAAMQGVGMAEQHEPGLTSPYDGIGDQAVAVGPALMIRTGEDLVTIVFSGVEDTPAVAKKIFDTAKAGM